MSHDGKSALFRLGNIWFFRSHNYLCHYHFDISVCELSICNSEFNFHHEYHEVARRVIALVNWSRMKVKFPFSALSKVACSYQLSVTFCQNAPLSCLDTIVCTCETWLLMRQWKIACVQSIVQRQLFEALQYFFLISTHNKKVCCTLLELQQLIK